MEYIVFIIGVFVGFVISSIIFHFRTASGTLKIDHSNPEKDVYRFEINNIDDLKKKKRVVLHIDNDADLSQD